VLGVLIRWKLPRMADAIGACGPTFAVVAFTLHVLGFGFGYWISKLLRYPESVARTVSIEVGMQNGGMAASLARAHFAAMPLAAAAGVFSGVMQNIIGGLAAAWWKRRPPSA
jgi:BASS family bile acid:Na+ symporter